MMKKALSLVFFTKSLLCADLPIKVNDIFQEGVSLPTQFARAALFLEGLEEIPEERRAFKTILLNQFNPYQDLVPDLSGTTQSQIKDAIKTILILCPPMISGGPENLSQFANEATKLGFEVRMVWYMGSVFSWLQKEIKDGKTYLTYTPPQDLAPTQYVANFGVKTLEKSVVLDDSTLVVIPEVITDYQNYFSPAKRVIAWLSLGFFESTAGSDGFKELIKHNALHQVNCAHWYHTPWIKKQIREWGLTNTAYVHDYISYAHRQSSTTPKIENSIAYFPRKGGEKAQKFIEKHPAYTYVRLENLNEAGMVQALDSARIYIDFGYFPGQDHTPREATLHDAIVFLRNVGCATDKDSFPVDDWFRFSDEEFENGVVEQKVRYALDHYEEMKEKQKPFKQSVIQEPEEFRAQVKAFLGSPNEAH